ncbi:MAG: carboxypeptidase-like regulatory domain-containing protein [Flavisolibacter sp.]|nr:carboxypeptidase-like regulatory domain-containing protein [Flavisolibacter sp.]
MKKNFYQAILSITALLLCLLGKAQERIVSGRVASEEGNRPLSGVTINVRGTSRSTTTNNTGNFTITAKPGDILQFSFIGMRTNELRLGDVNRVELQMSKTDQILSEVVVTAMDIRRNPRELGYSVQKVSGNELAETQRENFLNSLQGRVAGATINPTSGIAGLHLRLY